LSVRFAKKFRKYSYNKLQPLPELVETQYLEIMAANSLRFFGGEFVLQIVKSQIFFYHQKCVCRFA
jgi:hypothetical protein